MSNSPETGLAISFLCILLIPFALGGLALINTGLNRTRSAAHSMLSCLTVAGIAALAYFAVGFAVQGIAGVPGHAFALGVRRWDWIGGGSFFLRGFNLNTSIASLGVFFQFFGAALAAMIPLGSSAERWRLGACCASTVLLGAWTYPLFAHWATGTGWLAQFAFADPGGASWIHGVGGFTALAMAWLLGPRRGKFTPQSVPTAMPGHNAVIVVFGCLVTLPGWFGLNLAGAFLFGGAQPAQFLSIALNTLLAGISSASGTVLVTRLRFGRPDASLSANAWIAGLVASSASALYIKPAEAILIGFIAGVLIVFSVELLELRMKVDDPAGGISVHAIGGLWGVLAVGIFGRLGGSAQFLAQLVGVATLLGFVLPLTFTLNWILNIVLPHRVAAEAERQGMDLFELGAGAYPEFVTHREDYFQH